MQGMTLVKSNILELGAPGITYQVVDLGLGIDEGARILAVEIDIFNPGAMIGTWGNCQISVSFDPEDKTVDPSDDEQFAFAVSAYDIVGLAGGNNPMVDVWKDFSSLNLITTRNIALIMRAENAGPFFAVIKTFYEKFKPSQLELVQLIATRR